MSGEFERIARFFAPLASAEGLGLTDDAAIFVPPEGTDIVITVDQMVESIHFLAADPANSVARKLLRRNLSDIAAMGATPLHYLLTTALRTETPESWLACFAAGLEEDQRLFNISLIGGDSTSTIGPISLSVTMFGTVARGAAWRRRGARIGDAVFVTGTIGDAALGLAAAHGKVPDPNGFLAERRLLPEPRLGLHIHHLVHACIDVSDGLIQDLGHICRQSECGALIEAAAVPQSEAARRAGDHWLSTRLTGGDDYELLFAAPAEVEIMLRAAAAPVSITRIGYFVEGPPDVVVLDNAGNPLPITRGGWSHF